MPISPVSKLVLKVRVSSNGAWSDYFYLKKIVIRALSCVYTNIVVISKE